MSRILLAIFLTCSFIAYGQSYGNEWIDFNKSYYKMKVIGEDVYKVTYQDLQNVGVPVGSIDPTDLQVYYRGVEVGIYVSGEGDNQFDPVDYFLFYGHSSNGELETPLYVNAIDQAHTYYSLYSDTSYYYLTWESGIKGKRILTESGTGNTSAISSVREEKSNIFTNVYSKGEEPVEYVFRSEFDQGEGWVGTPFGFTPEQPTKNSQLYTFKEIKDIVPGANNIEVEVILVGMNSFDHDVEVVFGDGVKQIETFPIFTGHETKKATFQVNAQAIENESLNVLIQSHGNGGTHSDKIAIAYLKLSYDKLPVIENGTTESVWVSTAGERLELLGANKNYNVWNIEDPSTIVSYNSTFVGGDLVIELPLLTTTNKLILKDTLSYGVPLEIKSIDGFEDDLKNEGYLILTHEAFMDGAIAYADYRKSIQGGSHQVQVVEIERILDQYGYGEKNPLAVKNWLRYKIDNANSPEFLFIIGDGAAHNLQNGGKPYARKLAWGNSSYLNQDYIFSFGDPGWDMGFSSGLNGTIGLEPGIPTGRLACRLNADVHSYLNKVIEHESNTVEGLWHKRIVHLSGGSNSTEQASFLSKMNQYKDIAENNLLGGRVTTFTKNTNEVVSFFNISKQVNEGVGLITYFGHSSPTFIEVDIGTASEDINGYRNKGMYPMLFLNGCNGGNIFDSRSRSQDWLNTADRGAIASLAHSSFGYSSELGNYCQQYYQNRFADSSLFDLPVGLFQKELIRDYQQARPTNAIVETQAQQFFLLGDPSLVIFQSQGTDYTPERAFISSVDDQRVTAVSDTFELNIVVSNYGRVLTDSFSVCVERTNDLSGNQESYGPIWYSAVSYQDTLSFLITTNGPSWAGTNSFEISLDCVDSLVEDNENNNDLILNQFLPANGVNILFPVEFSIVPDSIIAFVVQSYDLSIDTATYVIQVDTNISFISPLDIVVAHSDANARIANYELPLSMTKDTTVFYVRGKLGNDSLWTISSFTYISSKEGQGQFEIEQFYRNAYSGIDRNIEGGKWEFDTVNTTIEVNSPGRDIPEFYLNTTLIVDQQAVILAGLRGGCTKGGVYLLAFDPISVEPFHPDGVGGGNCGQKPRIAASYTDVNVAANAEKFLGYLDKIKEGQILLLFTGGNAVFDSWPDSMKAEVEKFGALQLDSAKSKYPYILLGKKGASSPIFEMVGTSDTTILTQQIQLNGHQYRGEIQSPLIGPASIWHNFQDEFTLETEDSVSVDIYGVRLDFSDSLLSTLPVGKMHDIDLDTVINAQDFPYMRTETILFDSTQLTAPDLKYWSVSYKGVPEGTIDLSLVDSVLFGDIKIEEGQSVSYPFAFVNISEVSFDDSIVVEIQVSGAKGVDVWIEKLVPLQGKDTLFFEVNIPTVGLVGINEVQFFVNPYLQAEQDYVNNVITTKLIVRGDVQHPIIDVTINDRHIRNGDVVLNEPKIEVSIEDNNEFLNLKDTSLTFMFFALCETCDYQRIPFSDERVEFEEVDNNEVRIIFSPGKLVDGTYRWKVAASDASGNLSALAPYEITFRIESDKLLELYEPHPNPMTDDIRFIWDLTGGLPSDIVITFYTTKGAIVRQLEMSNFKVLHVGERGAMLVWDGRGDSGYELPNGLYIYTIDGGEGFSWSGPRKGKILLMK